MDCPQCSKSLSNSDGLVTHLTNAHDISRIKARKRVIELSASGGSDQDETPTNPLENNSASNSDRQVMLNRFRRQYDALGRMPTLTELNDIHSSNRRFHRTSRPCESARSAVLSVSNPRIRCQPGHSPPPWAGGTAFLSQRGGLFNEAEEWHRYIHSLRFASTF